MLRFVSLSPLAIHWRAMRESQHSNHMLYDSDYALFDLLKIRS